MPTAVVFEDLKEQTEAQKVANGEAAFNIVNPIIQNLGIKVNFFFY